MGKARFSGSTWDANQPTVTLQAEQNGVSTPTFSIPWGVTGSAPSIDGIPGLTGTLEAGETLTIVPATVTADPAVTSTVYQFYRSGVLVQSGSSLTYDIPVEETGGQYQAWQVITNDRGTTTARSVIRSFGVAVIERVVIYQGEQNAGNTQADTFTVPVPAELTGDGWVIYTMLGADATFTSLTIDSFTTNSRLIPDADAFETAGGQGRMSVFETPTTGLIGSGVLTITTDLDRNDNEYTVSIFAVRGGVLQTQFDDFFIGLGFDSEAGWTGIEVPGDGSLIVGLTSGHRNAHADELEETFPQWQNLEITNKLIVSGSDNDSATLAFRDNTPAGVYDEGVEFSTAATDRKTAALLIFVPENAPIPEEKAVLWSVNNNAAVTGDIIEVDVQGNPFKAGNRVVNYEIEMQKASGTVVERVLGGSATDYIRRQRCEVNATTVCRLRPVYQDQLTGVETPSDQWSDPKTVTTTTGAPRVTIKATRTTVYTGEAFILEIEADGFDTLRTQTCELDFWTTVDDVAEHGDLDGLDALYNAELPDQRTRHICRAHLWAFAARTTGTKTFTTTVRDKAGNIAMATVDVLAQDPLAIIDPANIYALSTAANFNGVPSGANTYNSVASLITAVPTSGNKLILIDEDEDETGALETFDLRGMNTVHLRSYGSGSRRALLQVYFKASADRFSWSGISITTPYDPSDYPNGVSFRPRVGLDIDLCGHSGVANTNLRGVELGARLPRPGNILAMFNTTIRDWSNFGIFGGDVGMYALFGGAIMQNPNVIRGVGKLETIAPIFPDHGPQRSSRPTAKWAIVKMMLLSLNGWGGAQSPQPCLRVMGGGNTPKPLQGMVSQCLLLSRFLNVTTTSRSAGTAANNPQDVRIDSSVVIGANSPTYMINLGAGGVTVTSSKFVKTNDPIELDPLNPNDTGGSGFRAMILMLDNRQNPVLWPKNDLFNQPQRFRNCTFVDLCGEAVASGDYQLLDQISNGGIFNDVAFHGCVEYAPNYNNTVTADGPFDTAFHGQAHPYQTRYSYDPDEDNVPPVPNVIVEPQYGVTDDAMASFAITTASPRATTSNANCAIRYADGTLIPATGGADGWLEAA